MIRIPTKRGRKRNHKPPVTLRCKVCGTVKPPTAEHWYIEDKPVTAACKVCVESRIQAQVPGIQKQVELGLRRKAHWEDSNERDHNAPKATSKKNSPLAESLPD